MISLLFTLISFWEPDYTKIDQQVNDLIKESSSLYHPVQMKVERFALELQAFKVEAAKEKDAAKLQESFAKMEARAAEFKSEVEAIKKQDESQWKQSWEEFVNQLDKSWIELTSFLEKAQLSFQDEWKERQPQIDQTWKDLKGKVKDLRKESAKDFSEGMKDLSADVTYFSNSAAAESEEFAQKLNQTQAKARQEILAFYNRSLVKLETKMTELRAKADENSKKAADALNEKYTHLQSKWSALKDASGDQWAATRKEFAEAWSSFKSSAKETGEDVKKFFFD